jgi:hypothetical protein
MHSSEPLAEMLGEEFVQAATSGEEAYSDAADVVATEELGGPFSEGVVDDEAGETPKVAADSVPLIHRGRKRIK